MPYEEIARALDMTVPATKSLLFRARNMLKEVLASFILTMASSNKLRTHRRLSAKGGDPVPGTVSRL
ncbi:MAG: RNA polymerase sigma factor [Akkermansia sp.]